MECPICLKKIESDSIDLLSHHLCDDHSFELFDAGRVAQKVKYWREYDALEAIAIQEGAASDTGDGAGWFGQRDGDFGDLSAAPAAEKKYTRW